MMIDLNELKRLAGLVTPGEWQHHMSHVYGPDPDRQLVCQFRNAPRPPAIRDLFTPARTVKPGKPRFDFAPAKQEAA